MRAKAKVRQAACPVNAEAINRELGQRVRGRRKQIGMTQTGLADQLGISFQQVQKYEIGVDQISVPKLVQIARALDVSLESLVRALP